MWLSILTVAIAMAIGLAVAAMTIQPKGEPPQFIGR
jgi:H+/gluconate symporter-like permease